MFYSMKTSIGIKHLNKIENSVSKSIGILFKAKEIINTKGLRSLYYSFIPIFLNYGSLSWGNTHKANLKIIASRQKHAIRTIESNTLKRTTEKIYKLEILNIYKINLYISLIFIFRVKNNTIPYVFHERFTDINHQYPDMFSQNNFATSEIKLSRTEFAMSLRQPRLWNNILTVL